MTRLLLLAAALFLAAYATACGGGSSDSGDPEATESGGDTSTPAADNVPAGLSLIVFRDTLNSTVIAHSIADGKRWQLSTDPEEFLVSMDCSLDGERAAYMVKDLQTGSEVRLSGGESQPVRIAGEAVGLAWSPDGSRIAVTAFDPAAGQNHLHLLAPISGALTTAVSGTSSIGAPRWSPDGDRIAFDAADGITNQLFVFTTGETAAVKVADRAQPSFAPEWSPDGSTLVFTAPTEANLSQLFTIGIDGANERQLTSSEIAKGFPRFSPDGATIAYAGTIIVPTVSRLPVLRHNLAVWTMNP
ncbi:MAG TPA: hypothetical protein VGR43_02485, partial [Dehalococcoidia bacterium]|nr:hypothetical protein [Dehalococcoidia bacterium]